MLSYLRSYIHTTDYREQARGLPVKNDYQLTLLRTADRATKVREVSKVVTVASVVSEAACFALQLDPKVAAYATLSGAVCWSLSSCCACYCEPKAQKLIRHLKEDQAEYAQLPPEMSHSPYGNANIADKSHAD